MSTRERPKISNDRVIKAGVTWSVKFFVSAFSSSVKPSNGTPIENKKASLNEDNKFSPMSLGSLPVAIASLIALSVFLESLVAIPSNNSSTEFSRKLEPPETILSSADSASRAEPLASRIAWFKPSSPTSKPASFEISSSNSRSCSVGSKLSSKCCDRLRIVSTTLCGSVVAITKIT
jgi:hypothetical protein